MSQLPVICGVYCLFKDRALTYVGKSRDIYRRIDAHRTNGREFDYATITAVPIADMDWVESAMITAMDTRQNLTMRPRPLSRQAAGEALPPIFKSDAPPSDDMAIAVSAAQTYIAKYALSFQDFRIAVKAGQVPSYPRNPARPENGQRVVLFGDLRKWCADQRGLSAA